jgi:MFS family permease
VDQIAFFLAAFVLGGALAQFPVGWLADKFDRRWVLIWLSGVSLIACAVTVPASMQDTLAIMVSATFFGLTTVPIFSVSAAHANDFADTDERVELSAALMFFYAVGAIAAPLVASSLIELFGPGALFTFVAVGHIGLIFFGLLRMRVRSAPEARTRYVYAPRTSFTIGKMLKRDRERHK